MWNVTALHEQEPELDVSFFFLLDRNISLGRVLWQHCVMHTCKQVLVCDMKFPFFFPILAFRASHKHCDGVGRRRHATWWFHMRATRYSLSQSTCQLVKRRARNAANCCCLNKRGGTICIWPFAVEWTAQTLSVSLPLLRCLSNLTSKFCVACRETVHPLWDAGALFVSLFKRFRRGGRNVINSNCLCVVVLGITVSVCVLVLKAMFVTVLQCVPKHLHLIGEAFWCVRCSCCLASIVNRNGAYGCRWCSLRLQCCVFLLLEKILRKPIRIYGIGTGIVTEHSLSTRMLACMDIWELYWNLFLSSAASSCFQCLHGLTTVSLISSTLLSLMSASLNAVVPYTSKWDVPMLPELCVVSILTFLIFGRCFGGSDELFLDWSVAPECVIGVLVFIFSAPQTPHAYHKQAPVLFWSIATRLCPFERAALESSV